VVDDGYSPTLNSDLISILKEATEQKIPLIVEGLKTLSRNIDVVLSVAEHLLCNDLMLITANYLISNGYVERRKELLRPGSTTKEMHSNLMNTKGISDAHRIWLEACECTHGNIF
jgi:hypothetical protein